MKINVWSNKVICDWLLKSIPEIYQIVFMSSGAAVNGNRGWGSYSLSKATLNMLAKLYAAEAKQTHFSALAPGLVDTAIARLFVWINRRRKNSLLFKNSKMRGELNICQTLKAQLQN